MFSILNLENLASPIPKHHSHIASMGAAVGTSIVELRQAEALRDPLCRLASATVDVDVRVLVRARGAATGVAGRHLKSLVGAKGLDGLD